MQQSIVALAKKLISIASIKDSPEKLKEVLFVAKSELSEFSSEAFEKNGVPGLIFYNSQKRPDRFKIILNAHLDVVPGKENQYSPVEKEGRLYGRGADDMKAAAAAEILLFKEVAKNIEYPLALQLVTDEEVGGHDGTKYQIEKGVRADFVIAGEPTDFGVNNKAKGITWVNIKTSGKAAHGAYLWQGDNALWKIEKILEKIKSAYPNPEKEIWRTTFNLAKIETSNKTFNKVPDQAVASFDVRFVPEDKDIIIDKIKEIVGGDGSVDIITKESPQLTDENNPYVKKLREATKEITGEDSPVIVKHGGSDIRLFNEVGCDGVTFGPIGFGLHTDDEWVDIKSLTDYFNILKTFLQKA